MYCCTLSKPLTQLVARRSVAEDIAGVAPEVLTKAWKRLPVVSGIVMTSDRLCSLRTGIEDISRSVIELAARMKVAHARAKLGTVEEYLDVTENLQVLLSMLMLSLVESIESCCECLRSHGAFEMSAVVPDGVSLACSRFMVATSAELSKISAQMWKRFF